ncbi:MAG: M28 family peptidase [Chthonomonadales bacterium]
MIFKLLALSSFFAVGSLSHANGNRFQDATISEETVKRYVTALASEPFGGRASGTNGNVIAAKYVASAFFKVGLKTVGTDLQKDATAKPNGSGYFQPFTFNAGSEIGPANKLESDNKPLGKIGADFYPSKISRAGDIDAPMLQVNYGIVLLDGSRNDYKDRDVQGKIVMVQYGADTDDPKSPLNAAASTRAKAMVARDKGAVGLIEVLKKGVRPDSISDDSSADAGLPIIRITQEVADSMSSVFIHMKTDIQKVKKTTANIVGLLEGSDPVLKDEVVVIGAHMDHLGMGGPGSLDPSKTPTIHPGADDNASGTAGVMMLAEYFSHTTRPKRSILFICFSGEELGLLGSAWYVANPIIPHSKTVAMLNMDMIGRMNDNKLIVAGSGTSTAWNGLLTQVSSGSKLAITKSDNGFGASDQASFYGAGMPVLFFFTGTHADYHRPSDTADKINFPGEVQVIQYVADCATRIANSDTRPDYVQMAVQKDSGPARFRVSLGSIPDYAADVDGVKLSGVREGSAAEKAGLKAGDIVVKFGGKTIHNVQDYTSALTEHKPGDVVAIVVQRGNETVTLSATLAASRR